MATWNELYSEDPTLHGESACPRVTFQCGNRTLDEGPEYLTRYVIPLFVSFLSCVGSVSIMVAYVALKDIRKGAQTIVTLLAIADFVYSLSFIMAPIDRLAFYREDAGKCAAYQVLCTIQAFLTVWSGWSVFLWNSVLALHFYIGYVLRRPAFANRLIIVYNVVIWGVSTVVAVSLLVAGKLGLFPSSPLCFIKPQKSKVEYNVVHLFGGELPELISFVFVGVLYTAIGVHICKEYYQSHLRSGVVQRAEKRLLLIPVLYIVLRIWDTIKYFMILGGFPTTPCKQTSAETVIITIIGILESIGDGGQGLVNAILFVFLSREIRRRLLWNPLRRLVTKLTWCSRERNRNHLRVESSETTPLTIGTNEPCAPGRHDYDTYFSLPSEFPHSHQLQSDQAIDQPSQLQSSLPAQFSVQSSSGVDVTYFSLPSTDIGASD